VNDVLVLALVLLLVGSGYAAGRVHGQVGYRDGYRSGYRQGHADGVRRATAVADEAAAMVEVQITRGESERQLLAQAAADPGPSESRHFRVIPGIALSAARAKGATSHKVRHAKG
jgi:hypothetical protein